MQRSRINRLLSLLALSSSYLLADAERATILDSDGEVKVRKLEADLHPGGQLSDPELPLF